MPGASPPFWLIPTLVIASVIVFAAFGWIILRGYRWVKRVAEDSQRRAYEGLKAHDGPAPGLVAVVFHTYYGFIVFVCQTEHRFWAPPGDGRQALSRLHRFNLSWGMFAYGALIIPLLSYGNYLTQMHSIRKQEAAMID